MEQLYKLAVSVCKRHFMAVWGVQ